MSAVTATSTGAARDGQRTSSAAGRSQPRRATAAAKRVAAEESAVVLTRGWRIVRLDERNWALQRRSGDGWQSKAFYRNLDGVLRAAERRLTNAALAEACAGGASLTDVVRILERTREEIVDELRAVVAAHRRGS